MSDESVFGQNWMFAQSVDQGPEEETTAEEPTGQTKARSANSFLNSLKESNNG